VRVEGRARVYRGEVSPYGEGTWLPVAQVVRAEAGIVAAEGPAESLAKLRARLEARHPQDEASLLEAQLGPLLTAVGTVASAADLVWAVRRYLDGLARERPTVVDLDDLHWAATTLVDTLQEIVETIPPVRSCSS
jgi:predicted ATPase